MGLHEFRSQIEQVTATYGLRTGLQVAAERALERGLIRLGQRINFGSRPLDDDWDVMIILDACRADLFEKFAPQHPIYDRFESVSARYSCASTSREWFEKGFDDAPDEAVAGVHYVSPNPYMAKVDMERFYAVEKLYEWPTDTDAGLLDSTLVTDHALRTYAESDADRFVVHYLPPHTPFRHCADRYTMPEKAWGGNTQDAWYGLQVGAFDFDAVWADYGQNLLTILDEVERLANHVERTVVVTADHGNALGEWGIYGHPDYVPLPSLKRVPWAVLQGRGEPYDPAALDGENRSDDGTADVEERLRTLGYR